MSVSQAEATAKMIPGLKHVVLWRGLTSLSRDLPSSDIDLLAFRSRVLVRSDLHPALQYLLLEVMREVHWAPGPFNPLGDFPAEQKLVVSWSFDLCLGLHFDGSCFGLRRAAGRYGLVILGSADTILRPASASASTMHFAICLASSGSILVVWMISASIAYRRGDYDVHLMRIGHESLSVFSGA